MRLLYLLISVFNGDLLGVVHRLHRVSGKPVYIHGILLSGAVFSDIVMQSFSCSRSESFL
jgi:hypothetical protein